MDIQATATVSPANKANEKPNDDINETKVISLMMAFTFFLASVKDGLGPLVSVYLVVSKGWTPGEAGLVWFARDGASLICGLFIGTIVDRSEHKRVLLLAATVISAVTATSFAWTENVAILIAMSIIAGAAASLIQPAKSALILGCFDRMQFDEVAKKVEMFDHGGSFVVIIAAGVVGYFTYPDVSSVFYIIGVGGLAACLTLLFMPLNGKETGTNTIQDKTVDADTEADLSVADEKEIDKDASSSDRRNHFLLAKSKIQQFLRHILDESKVDHARSRNLEEGEEPATFTSILKDKDIVFFGLSVFCFHLGNAAILPLLSQVIAGGSGRAGIPFTCGNIAIAQLTSIFSAWAMGMSIERGCGYKYPVVVGYIAAVPLRCLVIVTLIALWPNRYALMATQLLDGIGAGTFGLSMPLVTKALTHGTGHFSFTIGLLGSLHMIAAALSNLCAGYIVTYTSYSIGFICLGVVGSASVILMTFVNANPIEESQSKSEYADI